MADVPANANAGCPGVGSEGAGKAAGCAGCPNQGSCSTGQPPKPDEDIRLIQDRFRHINHKILILSGKGGVGKSTVTSSLARALAADASKQVAILDVDICGPSQPRMLGVEQEEVHDSADGWTPVSVKDNLMLMSIAFLLGNKNDAVIWRGARKNGMIKQFLRDVDWGETHHQAPSDEHISLVQFLLQAGTLDGAIIVSTPQEVSLLDVRKEVSFCHKTKVPILGVVENMAKFVCPHCNHTSILFPSTTGGATTMCDEGKLQLLSQLPLEPALAQALDNGEDFFEKYPDSAMAKAFLELAKKIEALLENRFRFQVTDMHRVVITGMGAVTPYGAGVPLLRKALLLESRSALKFSEEFGFMVGAIPDDKVDFGRWTAGQMREMSRASQLALLAAEEVMASSGAENLDHTDTLVNIGTGVSDLLEIGRTASLIEKGQARKVSPYFVPRILTNLPCGYVAMKYGMKGGAESTATACATGLHCIGNSFRAVRHGWARRAIAGATEGCVNAVALAGFDRMRALSRGKEPSCSRPFDKKRDGFVLSEGVGLVLLERLQDALERGAPILAEVLGYGISSDCYHISSPDPSGIGARLSMQRAIEDAKISPDGVSYVNAHATSTPTGDTIEALAIREVFGKRKIAVSSIKGHIGHLLAAAGSVEVIATVEAICEAKLPPNLNLDESDEDDGLALLRQVIEWPRPRIAMVNSFGFGGTNASIVISEPSKKPVG
ncbi:Beta-ketoacyl synthase protein [Cooperia oncophora]